MSNKRRNTSSPECEELPRKRRASPVVESSLYQDQDVARPNQQPHIDAATGQAGAFPGLGPHDEPFYGPAANGIDYLRMVRSEAYGIPQLLTSHKLGEATGYSHEEEYEYDSGDGGYYEDGAYTAKPEENKHDEAFGLEVAQTLYYESLLAQFRIVRATMKCIPSLSYIQTMSKSCPISFPADSKAAERLWEQHVTSQFPHPVQVSCMDSGSVLGLLHLLDKKLRKLFQSQDKLTVRRTGAWLWSLLGKCPDRGELAAEEISDLRALAKRAAQVLSSFDSDSIESFAESEDESMSSLVQPDNEIFEEISEARRRFATSDKSSDIKAAEPESENDGIEAPARDMTNTLDLMELKSATLDMVITIVGEVYGQRDLLELRKPWKVYVTQD